MISIINQNSPKKMNFFNVSRNVSLDVQAQILLFGQPNDQELPQTKPILQKLKNLDFLEPSDSMQYIQQFLTFNVVQQCLQDQARDYSQDICEIPKSIPLLTLAKTSIQQYPVKNKKKGKKVENSPFHNYQKHLNNALKRLIVVPVLSSLDQDFKIAAKEIWLRYLEMNVKTKKILHFIFNERNEHPVSQNELRSYGIFDVYQQFDIHVINKAKNYLSKLAIDQIDDLTLQGYLKTRKIKRMQGLKAYILSFKHQLQSGYLKRRINFNQSQL